MVKIKNSWDSNFAVITEVHDILNGNRVTITQKKTIKSGNFAIIKRRLLYFGEIPSMLHGWESNYVTQYYKGSGV